MARHLDLRALPCPGPVVELKKQLDAGERSLELHVRDELARSNVTRFGASRGAAVRAEPHPEGGFRVFVDVPGSVDASRAAPGEGEEPACELPDAAGPRVLQLTARTMGAGDDELGALLLRGFLKTLAGAGPRPDVVVCYNGAVALCCEGSPARDELAALAAAGTEILACGTCLNFFGMAEKLVVGRVTDMLEIVGTLGRAGSVLKP